MRFPGLVVMNHDALGIDGGATPHDRSVHPWRDERDVEIPGRE